MQVSWFPVHNQWYQPAGYLAWPILLRGSAAHRGGTKGLPPKSPCGYYPRPPFGLVFYLPSPTKAMPMDLRASTCLLAYWTSIVPLEPTSSLVSPQPEDTKELDT